MSEELFSIKIYKPEQVVGVFINPSAKKQEFTVFGRPQPQERARMAYKKTKTGEVKGWAYTPNNSRKWQEKVLAAVLEQRPRKITGPFSIVMGFYCERLKDISESFPTSEKHGDYDNLCKSAQDAICGRFMKIGGVQVKKPFPSDAQIINAFAFKRFPSVLEQPHVKIWVIEHD